MNRTVSVVYTVVVVIVLLGVIGFIGRQTYDSRARRIADFSVRTKEYTKLLGDSLVNHRDVNAEVKIAEKLMENDPTLVAVQVFSQSDGLRISVVKPIVGDFGSTPLAETDRFDGFFARIRYHLVKRPLMVDDMAGLEAFFVSATLTNAELRNNLLIVLITVGGLFLLTLGMIFIRPGRTEPNDDGGMDGPPEKTLAPDDGDDFEPVDFNDATRLDENDLPDLNSEIGDLLPMDDDFDIPDLDDFSPSESEVEARGDFLDRLERELERAASFNQDLSLMVFSTGGEEDGIRDFLGFHDLVFDLDKGRVGVIEINKTLDQTLAATEDIVRNRMERTGTRSTRAGIASRNGRLISAEHLWGEAESALGKADESKTIVGFRSDPEKYRRFLKDQGG